MFELLAYLAVTALMLFFGYLASVFSNAIYIDPEDIESVFSELSERRIRQLTKFTSNPRAFYQVAFFVRLTSALIAGIMALAVARVLAAMTGLPAPFMYFVIFVIFWAATIILLIYLPRRISPGTEKSRLIKFLPLINVIYVMSLPFITGFKRIYSNAKRDEIPEEQKDDIVERAIETLAETAGYTGPIIEEDEKEMIHQIFQLDVTEVEEIMIPRVNIKAFQENTDLVTIRETVSQWGYSRYPVYRGTVDNILGILKVKDLLLLGERQQRNFNLIDHIREPLRVGQYKKIDQLLAEFKSTKIHMAIVLDEFGGTAGLVTLEDILEEIVGEIQDEDDAAEELDIVALDNGNLEVRGSCPLEDLADHLGLDYESEEFETVGGMIYDQVGSVPTEGVSLTWQNCRLKVLEVDGQRINKVLVLPGS